MSAAEAKTLAGGWRSGCKCTKFFVLLLGVFWGLCSYEPQQPEGHKGPTDMKPFKSAFWRCRRNNSKTTTITEAPETANVCSVQPLLPDEPKLFSFLFLFNSFFLGSQCFQRLLGLFFISHQFTLWSETQREQRIWCQNVNRFKVSRGKSQEITHLFRHSEQIFINFFRNNCHFSKPKGKRQFFLDVLRLVWVTKNSLESRKGKAICFEFVEDLP